MLGLYIPGIEMPKHCGCCKAAFPDGVGFSCCMIKGYPPIDNQRGRRPSCPLHELPPHGDLIDRGGVLRALAVARGLVNDQTTIDIVERFIKDTTVIVPAEEGST